MKPVSRLFLISLILFPLLACEEKKPDFVVTENYKFLEGKKKKVLVLLNVFVDLVQQRYYSKPDPKMKKFITNFDFKQGFRWKLAKELYNIDQGKKLDVDFTEKAEDDNNIYFKYMGKKYPGSIKSKGYDLALEVKVKLLIFNNLGHLDLTLSEEVRLVDLKSNDVHLSSFSNRSYGSVGRKVPLSKDIQRFRLLLQNVINRSTGKIAKYVFNKEKKPHFDDIAPISPTFKKK
ncbi:MAG: hypothetical protein OEZ36_03650 [Spirochaetota bacterium]|nr:hypothetical protein [Spirochaetota bacterium]